MAVTADATDPAPLPDGVGRLTFPQDLPISARAEELIGAIREHQVLVVAGETGSGKSTQLPKLCLAAGLGTRGLIGHTQPRRIAARAVAERVAEELGTTVGELVGYKVRFTDTVSEQALIKVMTDGILLNELTRDRDLSAYEVVIIDEAHERGLNIDFILGYLKQLLPRRPDLKVIITSATIDTERFAEHFSDAHGRAAPIVEVSGRTYPVELRYRPLEHADDHGNIAEVDLVDGIVEACRELMAEGPGDILVFASGERDIRDAAEALGKAGLTEGGRRAGPEILPLYSRLSAAEQHRVFAPHKGRRIVIATNIAETSLTVPGIRYVVDPGLARISRYSRRTKVQRLPIEKISRASADQRSGRCGRLGPGIAIRLFDEEDLASRSEFTEPEILRTNLASVILQMTAIGLGEIQAFPFVDPPDRRQISDGITLLEELTALRPAPGAPGGRALTEIGRTLARLPVDPRLGRMIIAAGEHGASGDTVVHEVMVIAAALSIQDPRERPTDKRHTAEQYHQRHVQPGSDFLTLVNLWDHLRQQQHKLSGNQFRKRCREEFLHFLRVREWQDVYSQLRRVGKSLGLPVGRRGEPLAPDDHEQIHRAMLTGLLSNIGVRVDRSDGAGQRRSSDRRRGLAAREYQGTRGTTFVLGRGSALAGDPPGWIVAAELVETNRLWASMAAVIRPEWVEQLAGDLVTRSHSEPTWDRSRASATTIERVTFRGVPIVEGRRINLGRVDIAAARRMFIEHALVNGDWDADHDFLTDNAARVEAVRKLEERLRRPGLIAPEDVLAQTYERHVPDQVHNGASFERWWRTVSPDRPRLLDVDVEDLLGDAGDLRALRGFPETWRPGGAGPELQLEYRFSPEDPEADGVTVDIPLAVLPQVHAGDLDWQVPGLRQELVVALIRALPKPLRRALVPAPETATRVLDRMDPGDGPFLPTLARRLTEVGGVEITTDAWAGARLPPHLRMRYRIVNEHGGVLASGTDLSALKQGVTTHLRQAVRAGVDFPERTGATTWTFGDLPRQVTHRAGAITVTAHPSLVDEGSTVGVRALPSRAEQDRAMRAGTRRLLRLALPNPVRSVAQQLTQSEKLALTLAPHADVAAVVEDCLTCVIDAIIDDAGGPVYTQAAFQALEADGRTRSPRLVLLTARATAQIITLAGKVRDRLRQPLPAKAEPARTDIAQQLGRLVYPGFVAATGGARLPHLPRYLQGMLVRLDGMGRNVQRDADRMAAIRDLEEELRLVTALRQAGGADPHAPEVRAVRWSLEELRVSAFAQQLGTAEKVSEPRVRAALAALRTR